MGLLRREREPGTRPGEVVDVALYEAVYSLMESLLPDFDAHGVVRGPAGSALPGVAPSNTYRCADGKYIVVSGNGDAIFRRLMHAIGRADLAADPRLADNAGRVRHADLLDDAIGAWAATLTQEAAEAALLAAAVPSGPILTAADIAKDPHFEARGMHERHRVRLGEDLEAEVTFPGIVPSLTERPGRTRALGPDLGADTEAVLAELGITGDAVAGLRQNGVI